MNEIVGIEKDDIFPRSIAHPGIPRVAQAPVRLIDNPYAAVPLGIARKYLTASVGTSVIDAYSLPVSECLPYDTVETASDVFLHFIDRYDDRYSRHCPIVFSVKNFNFSVVRGPFVLGRHLRPVLPVERSKVAVDIGRSGKEVSLKLNLRQRQEAL